MKFYNLADRIPNWKSIAGVHNIKAVRTGEFRPPKKWEWYLSGGPAQAWRAPNDYLPHMKFHIAKLVRTKTVTQTIYLEDL